MTKIENNIKKLNYPSSNLKEGWSAFEKLNYWCSNYEKGVAVNPRKHPQSTDDNPKIIVSSRKHKIKFTYNELKYITQCLDAYDKNNRQAILFNKAFSIHSEMEKIGKITYSMEYSQTYDIPLEEIEFVAFLILKVLNNKLPETKNIKSIEQNW